MPGLRHVFERPEVASVRPADDGTTEVRVTGLACTSICVRRTESALQALPGVKAVHFSPDPDRFRLDTEGPPPGEAEIARAVRAMVVGFWLRRLVAAVAERLSPRP
jgi:copper chaperone CopZ